jgi:glycosyltransferase involved in cell wall biosynthesis
MVIVGSLQERTRGNLLEVQSNAWTRFANKHSGAVMFTVDHETKRQETRVDSRWPKIALVTPVYNSVKYIEQTIRSVLAQGYPNLEYYIVDGGSTDGTVEVIREYEGLISGWTSEPDRGMYDAINKGFARTRGEIMGWISATDMFHVGGLLSVGAIFRELPDIEWITGRPTRFSEEGMTINVDGVPHWSRPRFLAGFNRYIQQESTFWRRSLWDRAGAYVNSSLRMNGDFELWLRFFRYARLYPADVIIGGFRLHDASLGLKHLEECHRLQEEMIVAELASTPGASIIRGFRHFNAFIKKIPIARYAWWHLIERRVPSIRGPDWPSTVRYDRNRGWMVSTGNIR